MTRADVARRAVGVEVQRRGGREVGEDRLGLVGLVEEGLVDGEAVPRGGDARAAARGAATTCRSRRSAFSQAYRRAGDADAHAAHALGLERL